MGMIDNPRITTLIGEISEQGTCTWSGTLAAPNGSLYGIPSKARRAVKFDPVDKSITEIGPDFGNDRAKWSRGAMTVSGIIYCLPGNTRDLGILKIDTNTDNVTELDVNLLPEQGYGLWTSCALALDGCIYFMPHNARRIMKLDPNNDDAMTSVGDDVGDRRWKYIGTVVGIDGCVYGIPLFVTRIIKYDPVNDTTSFVGENADKLVMCQANGALGRDGCIYALSRHEVLKIDTVNNSHSFVRNSIDSDHSVRDCWGDAILGIDGCIYWPPYGARRTLKYDPHSNQISRVGDDFGGHKQRQWISGALATDGIIYCIPEDANQVLAIDPLGEFSAATKTNMQKHPEELGFLFRTDDTNNNTASNRTYFDGAVTKFGMQKVLEVMQEHMPPADEVCGVCGLYPFMIAASYKDESPLSVIYFLMRQEVPSLINRL